MRTQWLFDLVIEPQPKLRPKFSRRGASVVAYTPAKTRSYEALLKALSLKHRPEKLIEGPIDLRLVFFLTKPKTSKNRLPIVRPDLDNYIKAVKDALNGVFWKDDSQIVFIEATKMYSLAGKTGVLITKI
jgi:Holliday junction resolvase RusA-like endonuclease